MKKSSTHNSAGSRRWLIFALTFAGTLAIRIRGIDRHFWLLEDQIRDWGIALRPLGDLPLVGSPTHVGGYTIGPAFYWILWLIRVAVGPWFDNLPHAGGIGQAMLQSAADTMLLAAVWRRTSSLPLALTAMILLATPAYDVALSALVWNPMAGAALAKIATALVVMRWPERSIMAVAATAAVAWCAVHAYTGAIFMALGVFGALVSGPAVKRDWVRAGRNTAIVTAVVAILQVPWAVHQISTGFVESGMGAVTGSVAEIASGRLEPQYGTSWDGYKAAFNLIMLFPWSWPAAVWLLPFSALVVLSRFRDDAPLLSVTLAPQMLAVVGYAFFVGDFLDHYYYFSLMPAAVLTLTLALTAVRPAAMARSVAVAALAGAIAIVPARLHSAASIMRMPQYAALVDGSRALANRREPLREIRTEFELPRTSDPQFIFKILGGRLDERSKEIGIIKPDGSVAYKDVGGL